MAVINAYISAVNEAIRTGYGAKRSDDGKYSYPKFTASSEEALNQKEQRNREYSYRDTSNTSKKGQELYNKRQAALDAGDKETARKIRDEMEERNHIVNNLYARKANEAMRDLRVERDREKVAARNVRLANKFNSPDFDDDAVVVAAKHAVRSGNTLLSDEDMKAARKKLEHRQEAKDAAEYAERAKAQGKKTGGRILGSKYWEVKKQREAAAAPATEPEKLTEKSSEAQNVYNKEATEAKQSSQASTPSVQSTNTASAVASTSKSTETKPAAPAAQFQPVAASASKTATPTPSPKPALSVSAPTTAAAPTKKKFTTGQKIGIGAGVVGATGAVALGARAAYNHKKYGDALHDFHEFQRKRAERKALKEGKTEMNESVYHQIASHNAQNKPDKQDNKVHKYYDPFDDPLDSDNEAFD